MRITRKSDVKKPIVNFTGEEVYELVGIPETLGGDKNHSVAYVVIPQKCSSRLHYHPTDEETYYILRGRGRIIINEKEHEVCQGDAILIHPLEKHHIFTVGDTSLEFLVISAPAWQPSGTVFV